MPRNMSWCIVVLAATDFSACQRAEHAVGEIPSDDGGQIADGGAGGNGGAAGTVAGTVELKIGAANEILDIALDSSYIYWVTPLEVRKFPLAGGASVMLAGGLNGGNGIAVDGTSVYWIESGSAFSNDAKVMSVPLGGGTPVGLAYAQSHPADIAIDAESVYWVNQGSITGTGPDRMGGVLKAPLRGGAMTVLATGLVEARRLAVSKTDVYWLDASFALMKVPKAGGASSRAWDPNGSGEGASDLVLDASTIFFSTGTRIVSLPLAGGNVGMVAPGPAGIAMAQDASYIYLGQQGGAPGSNGPGTNGRIQKVPKTGGVPVTVTESATIFGPRVMVLDDRYIYWAEQGLLFRAPK